LRQHNCRRNHCGHAGEALLMAWAVLLGLLGYDWTHLRRGEIRGRLDAQKHHLAPTVLLHAATIVALADTACRYGCLPALPDGASGSASAPRGADWMVASPFAGLPNMSPELMFWFALVTKMAITALFVSAATIIAERLGAAVGALVAGR
jgi:hypothetical protein